MAEFSEIVWNQAQIERFMSAPIPDDPEERKAYYNALPILIEKELGVEERERFELIAQPFPVSLMDHIAESYKDAS